MSAVKKVRSPLVAVSMPNPKDDFASEMNKSLFDSAYQMGDSKYAYLPIAALSVDEADTPYQRGLHITVMQLCNDWNSEKLDPLVVNYRDNRFMVIDGKHRLSAAKMMGMTHLPCRILSKNSIESEAKYFAHQDDNRTMLSAFEKYHASYIAKEREAVILHDICAKYGIEISCSSSSRAGCLGSIQSSLNKIRRNAEWFEEIIQTLDNAGWTKARYGLSSSVITAIDRLRVMFSMRRLNGMEIRFVLNTLADKLKMYEPLELFKMVREKHPNTTISHGVRMYVVNLCENIINTQLSLAAEA